MDKSDLRKENLRLLKKKLREVGQTTKPELSEMTGLSVVTVNSLLKIMLKSGEVEENKFAPSGGGRPARQYRFVANHRLILACYVYEEGNCNSLIIFLVNLAGEIVEQQGIYPEEINQETFFKFLYPYITKYPQIVAVMIGLPGTEINGKMEFVPYPGLKDVALTEWLSAKLSRPVRIENEVNAAVMGSSMSSDSLATRGTIVGVAWSRHRTPGAGIMIGGNLYKGRDGTAGKIGSIIGKSLPLDKPVPTAIILTKLFTALFNPGELVLYHEGLKTNDTATIIAECGNEIPQKFLPQILIRSDMGEDYSQGIYGLAYKHLRQIDDGAEK